MDFATPFNRLEMHKKTALAIDPDEAQTKQSFKDECDINHIMARYKKTGQLPDMIRENPQFGDFSDVPSYLEAWNRVQFAETQFAALPAAVRQECFNDPAVFLEKVKDKEWAQKHALALTPSSAPSQGVSPAPAGGGTQEAPEGAAATQPAAGAPAKGAKKST